MQYSTNRRNARLSIDPLLDVLEEAKYWRRASLQELLQPRTYEAFRHARRVGRASINLAEDICDQLGHHPYAVFGETYNELAEALGACGEPVQLPSNLRHGMARAYDFGCRCDDCTAAKRTHDRRTRASRRGRQQAGVAA